MTTSFRTVFAAILRRLPPVAPEADGTPCPGAAQRGPFAPTARSLGAATIARMSSETTVDEDVCLGLLSTATFGRVSLSARAMPRIVPVRFSVNRRRITAHLQCNEDLGEALDGAVVALQADGFDERTQQVWSVHAIGRVLARSGSDFVVDPTVLEASWLGA